MAKSKSYQNSLIESLKDPTEAAEYLNAALEDGEPEVFLLALRDVVDSYGGMGKLAASTSLNRENLYRMLSTKGNPEFFSLSTVLDAVGFRLAVEPKSDALARTKNDVSKLVLHAHLTQVKELAAKYALAADSQSRTKSTISLRTSDDNEVGTLDFDDTEGTLILQVDRGYSCEKDSNSGNSDMGWQNSFRKSFVGRKESLSFASQKESPS